MELLSIPYEKAVQHTQAQLGQQYVTTEAWYGNLV